MADHPWIQENLAAYLAGGLTAAEAGQLEQHVAGCKPCARLLEEARHVDQSLRALFTSAQPEPGFEDRAIERVRKARQRRWPRTLRYVKYAAAAAAVLGVAGVGVTVNSLIGKDGLSFPDQSAFALLTGGNQEQVLEGDQALVYSLGGVPTTGMSVPHDWSKALATTDQFVGAKKEPEITFQADLEHYRKMPIPGLETDPKAKTSSSNEEFGVEIGLNSPVAFQREAYPVFAGAVSESRDKNQNSTWSANPLEWARPGVSKNPTSPSNNPAGVSLLQVKDVDPAQVQQALDVIQGRRGDGTGTVTDRSYVYSQLPTNSGGFSGGFGGGGQTPSSTGGISGGIGGGIGGIGGGISGGIGGGIGGTPNSQIAAQDTSNATFPTSNTSALLKHRGPPVAQGTVGQKWYDNGFVQPTEKGADPFPPELQNSLGYNPPATALGVNKGMSRLHTNLGNEPAIGPGPIAVPDFNYGSIPTGRADGTTAANHSSMAGEIKAGETKIVGNDVARDNIIQRQVGQFPGQTLTYPDLKVAERNLARQNIYEVDPSKGYKSGDLSNKNAPSNEKLDYFKPAEVKLGEQAGQAQVAGNKPAQGQAEGKPLNEKGGKPIATGRSDNVAFATENEQLKEGQTKAPSTASTQAQPAPRKVIIRTGEMEFEVESFDAATAIITRLVNAVPGGFVATTNSEKLTNGKMRGSVVVRVPPEHLDALVDNLRKDFAKGGELKNQRIGSQDVTKQFTDLESRLRAARTMEERLLQIIKTGKGEVKDLLNVEKELGIWHTKIEEMEGELRFMGQQVALSTLTISLTEKEIRAPYGMLETERINMGVETEDVEKAQKQALAIVADVKGRITKSELKQLEAGQYSAILNFEVPPDASGPVRDRFKQLGNLARFDVNRLMEAEGGTGKPQDGKVTRKDAQFFVSLYNLANVAPREVVNFDVATADAEAAYKAVLTRIQKLGGRVVTSNLNRQNNDQTVGTINFQVKAAEADGFDQELKAIGETLRHQTVESADSANTTRSKRGFVVQILAYGSVPARETTTLQMATPDVPVSFRKLQEAIATAKGRLLSAQLNEQNRQNATATLDFEVRRENEAVVRNALDSLGDVLARNVGRVPENENALNSKVRLQVTLLDAARIPPRETTTLGLEVSDVDMASTNFSSLVLEKGGRTVGSTASRERSGKVTSKMIFYVPLAAATELVERFKSVGVVRVLEKDRNPQVSDGSLAVARIDVTLSNSELIVPSDQGLWPQIRRGLSTSFVGLSWSLTVVIIGILFVLPWLVAIWGGWRLVRWMRRAPRGA